jgi:hypothetical protein
MAQAERRPLPRGGPRDTRALSLGAAAAVAGAGAVKLALFALVVYAATHRHLPELAGRTTTARIVVYPLVALAVPLGWSLLQALVRRWLRYPATADALLTLPFALDLAGTILDLPERRPWWDEAAHFTYWALLVGAFGAVAFRLRLAPLVAAGLALGFGATTAVAWELVESLTLHRPEATRAEQYSGTMRDLRPRAGRLDSRRDRDRRGGGRARRAPER